jgi:hypothetical protein
LSEQDGPHLPRISHCRRPGDGDDFLAQAAQVAQFAVKPFGIFRKAQHRKAIPGGQLLEQVEIADECSAACVTWHLVGDE